MSRITRSTIVTFAVAVAYLLIHQQVFPDMPLGAAEYFTAMLIGAGAALAVEFVFKGRTRKPAPRKRRAKPAPELPKDKS